MKDHKKDHKEAYRKDHRVSAVMTYVLADLAGLSGIDIDQNSQTYWGQVPSKPTTGGPAFDIPIVQTNLETQNHEFPKDQAVGKSSKARRLRGRYVHWSDRHTGECPVPGVDVGVREDHG